MAFIFLTYGQFVEYMNIHAASALCNHDVSNVGGVTAGQPRHHSGNVGSVTAGRWVTTLVYVIIHIRVVSVHP